MEAPDDTPRDVARFTRFLKTGMPGMHTYTVLLGLDYFDLPNVRKAVEKGFPWKAFERLTTNFGLPGDRVAEIAGIPRRTLARRKAEGGRFTADESDRLLRVARVLGQSLRLFDGNRQSAVTWLTSLQRALGAEPVALLSSDYGAREVERVLGALEHGVYL
ncbi:MAG TPA: antitoxin Xre-like helix-turn-helix domain-containing protein [Thermoanaerobaculia bacterium]|nr:antitoxin Xre-like helix-turn-helix domain-containing protein [Thermoanaerobaculia bacterium]